MFSVSFSLGSNIGDKIGNIENALEHMDGLEGLEIEQASYFYKTEPWGMEDQDWFINICATGVTSFTPRQLMLELQKIEKSLGRQKSIRWGPRLIDIDILLYETESILDEDLIIPHKSLKERAFVLVPLADLMPHYKLEGRTVAEWADEVNIGENMVIRLAKAPWSRVQL